MRFGYFFHAVFLLVVCLFGNNQKVHILLLISRVWLSLKFFRIKIVIYWFFFFFFLFSWNICCMENATKTLQRSDFSFAKLQKIRCNKRNTMYFMKAHIASEFLLLCANILPHPYCGSPQNENIVICAMSSITFETRLWNVIELP